MTGIFRGLIGVSALALAASSAAAQTELRMMWYNDGIEGEVMEAILERFEAEHPEISVTLDVVPYKAVLESLPIQLAAGEGPDIARVTDLGGLSPYYLDMTTYLSDPDYWRENFGPFLAWLDPDGSAISGFMTQLTVTGPYVNKTLFEQAGVEMPGFWYHERVTMGGSCGLLLVEGGGGRQKPAACCAKQVKDLRPGPEGQPAVVKANSPMVKEAREGVMEFLLINHPLDCPICDQGGECDLQDQAIADTAGRREGFRTVGGDPHRRLVADCPGKLDRFRAFAVLRFFTPDKLAKHFREFFKAFQRGRLHAHDADRAVATPDPDVEPAARLLRQRPEKACGNGPVARVRIGHARAEAHVRRVLHTHGHRDITVPPEDMAVVKPAICEAGVLGLPNQRLGAICIDKTLEANSKFHPGFPLAAALSNVPGILSPSTSLDRYLSAKRWGRQSFLTTTRCLRHPCSPIDQVHMEQACLSVHPSV